MKTEANGIAVPEGRDPAGRFAPGNKISLGNPYNQRAHILRQSFIDTALEEAEGETKPNMKTRFGRVCAKLFDLAEGGDVQAARLCCEYTLGRPQTSITIETDNGPAYRIVTGMSEDDI